MPPAAVAVAAGTTLAALAAAAVAAVAAAAVATVAETLASVEALKLSCMVDDATAATVRAAPSLHPGWCHRRYRGGRERASGAGTQTPEPQRP